MERLVGRVGYLGKWCNGSAGENYDTLFGGPVAMISRRRETVCRRLVSHLSVTRLTAFDFHLERE